MQKGLICAPHQNGMKFMIEVNGLILAAGASRRMGSQNKALATLNGTSLIERVIDRLMPQVARIAISGQREFFEHLPFDVIEDELGPFNGPLIGLHSAFKSVELMSLDYLMMVACDGVFFPADLVEKLQDHVKQNDADIGCIRYEGCSQPMFSLWHKRTAPSVARAVLKKKQGGFKPLLAKLRSVYLDWPMHSVNPFFNINTPADLQHAENLLCR